MKEGILRLGIWPLLLGVVSLTLSSLAIAALPMPANTSLVYRVDGLDAGNVLKMYKEPGQEVVVNIPHNATWISRRNAQLTLGDKVWEKVSWDNQTGWVLSDSLAEDPNASAIARARHQCLADPAVQDKMCCGYPEAAKGGKFRSVPVYEVTGLQAGESLMMYVDHGDNAIAVELPHSASNVVKMGQRAEAGTFAMERVRWAGQNGWVNAVHLQYDVAATKENDMKRQRCGGVSEGVVDFRSSEVVCLPAPVIRRLQESGALDADVLKQLMEQGAAAK